MKYIRNDSTEPAYNLAFEEWVFETLRDDDYVLFWRNDNAIIVGRNQNTVSEINAQYVEEHGIHVIRRETGGGAVYHDLGNLNFSIISDAQDLRELDFSLFTLPVMRALEKLGINATLTGRNDLTIDNMKFSGIAQRQKKGRVLNHGTLLFDSNLSVLSACLNPRKEKIHSKGIRSVAARVTNIRPYLKKELDILAFRDLLLEAMFEEQGGISERVLTEEELMQIQKLRDEKYATTEWNFGRSPKAEIHNYRYFPGVGGLEIYAQLDKNRLSKITFFGDFFAPEHKEILEGHLAGTQFQPSAVREKLNRVELSRYIGNIDSKELIDLLFEEQKKEE